jgi:hypothetical protein
MKRHAALHPLSHDHQNALARALRLRRVRDGDAAARDAERRSFVAFANERLTPHFREEERLVARAVQLAPAVPALEVARARLLDEHERLRAGIAALDEAKDAPDGGDLHALGELLTAHVRFEERELFELLQREFDGDTLEELVHA